MNRIHMTAQILLHALLLGALLPGAVQGNDPWEHLPTRGKPLDHSPFYTDSLASGPEVTRTCLACHEEAAKHVQQTAHWNWQGSPMEVRPGEAPIRFGKANALNNFCIGVESNWPRCTTCHAGYGWKDAEFDFSIEENVDCLVCHDGSGSYRKGLSGLPDPAVDLRLVAASVGPTSRQTCGSCHFNGGGGNAVKHGDLDQSLLHPGPRLDVHMGKHDFQCTDCHWTEEHRIPGRAISVSLESDQRVTCDQCHTESPHDDERLNLHGRTLACQTCHIPEMAQDEGTKLFWDWSVAGDRERERAVADPHRYMARKGAFEWEHEVVPEYEWYNGKARHYLAGDSLAEQPTILAGPLGDIRDEQARIWPFKIHRGRQVYDTEHRTLLVPKTFGPGGYWTTYDWDQALELGSEASGIPYSGSYGFTETEMYWPLSHMVAEKSRSLQCDDCHGEQSRMDWEALGYQEDPLLVGGRRKQGKVVAQ